MREFRYFECRCSDEEHTLRFSYDEDGIYVCTYLNRWDPWWKRIWAAIKHILNFEPAKYGHFDTCLLRDEDIKEFMKMLKEWRWKIEEERQKVAARVTERGTENGGS